MLLFDFHTRRWTTLATGGALVSPNWSHDALAGVEQPIFRVRLADRRVARVVTSGQLQQSNVAEYSLSALAPGDVPIALVDHRNADIYALDVKLP